MAGFPSRLLTVLVLCAGAALVGEPAAAQSGERIRNYDVDLRIEGSGALRVTERIEYDFGAADRHGIIRSIPVRSRYDDTYDRIYPLTVLDVRGSAGTPDQYEAMGNGNQLDIRIGDPDRTITGRHRYTVVYRIEGVLNRFADQDELYWNAVGEQWSVPIDRASARVVGPAAIERAACFTGPAGSRQPCATQRVDGTTATLRDTGLRAGEGLTVVVGFPSGAVPTPRPILDERWIPSRAFSITPLTSGLFGVLSLLALLAVGLLLRTGRDRRPTWGQSRLGIEYRPPDGVPPGLSALLVDETVRPVDVTATIVDLAARGYLRIEPVDGGRDWRLVRLRGADEHLLHYERLLLEGLFRPFIGTTPMSTVLMSGLRRQFAERYAAVHDALYDEAVSRGWFAGHPDRVRKTGLIIGGVVLSVGVIATVLAAWVTEFGIVPIPVVLAGLAIMVGARWLPRRTAAGNVLYREACEFRRYLRDNRFASPPGVDAAGSPARYLAYAMVFGMTAQWQAAVHAVQHGSRLSDVGPFSRDGSDDGPDDFARSWGPALTAPSPSDSSGFGSGGSSGGGSGGGGGSSW